MPPIKKCYGVRLVGHARGSLGPVVVDPITQGARPTESLEVGIDTSCHAAGGGMAAPGLYSESGRSSMTWHPVGSVRRTLPGLAAAALMLTRVGFS